MGSGDAAARAVAGSVGALVGMLVAALVAAGEGWVGAKVGAKVPVAVTASVAACAGVAGTLVAVMATTTLMVVARAIDMGSIGTSARAQASPAPARHSTAVNNRCDADIGTLQAHPSWKTYRMA
jgi:hypothetical protein